MSVNHRVGAGHGCGWFTYLAFLCEDAQAVAGQFLQEPCVNDIKTMVGVTFCPSVPTDPCQTILGLFKLYHFCVDRETEGLEEEGGVSIKRVLVRLLIVSIGRVTIIFSIFADILNGIEDGASKEKTMAGCTLPIAFLAASRD